MWVASFLNFETAQEFRLLPGDGIQIEIQVMNVPAFRLGADVEKCTPNQERRFQRLELLSMDKRGFVAREPSGKKGHYEWYVAVGYEKRHEV